VHAYARSYFVPLDVDNNKKKTVLASVSHLLMMLLRFEL